MSHTPETLEDRADQAVNEYLRRVDSGEDVNQSAFMTSHPDVADALQSYFAGERLLHDPPLPLHDRLHRIYADMLSFGAAVSEEECSDVGRLALARTFK